MEDKETPSPAFLAMQEKLAARKAGSGSSSDLVRTDPISYYKSHNPNFSCVYDEPEQEIIRIKFVNSVYSTDDSRIKEFLYHNFVKRGHIVKISKTEFEENTSIQRVQSGRSFVDMASASIKVGMAGSENIIK